VTATRRTCDAEADLLRRALKNHDAICAGLRAGVMRSPKAIDDMQQVKAEAAALGCYPFSWERP